MYKNKKRLITFVIALALICGILLGCEQEKAKTAEPATTAANMQAVDIKQDNMMNIIKDLTSERYKGRLAGSAENALVAQYIVNYFSKIGLENPRGLNNYMYDYGQPLVTLKEKPIMQILDNKGKITSDFNYPENFVLRRLSSETNNIDINAPLFLVDDINMIYEDSSKLKGKILLIPWKYYSLLGSQNSLDDYAIVTGALGVISEFDLEKNDLGYKYLKVRPLSRALWAPQSYRPFAFVDSDTFSKLTTAAESKSTLRFACNSEVDKFRMASNCIGIIPGSDPLLKDEHIIIGAHFDHVGDNMDGTWNPGALDNASGTAAMLEIARVIKERNLTPKRTILFMAFNGEESGLYGSRSYSQGPLYPMDKAVMINMDMVGSASNIPLSIATASDKSDSLRDTLAAYAEELSIEYEKIVEAGSDHSPFDSHGVPAVCLVNLDLSSGYHSPHDTIETINVDRLEEVSKLVLYYIEKNAY